MNADVKQQWLAALRSGEYEQGQMRLRQKNQYCCLGVLCDLAAKQGIGYWNDWYAFVSDLDGRETEFLPDDVVNWAGLAFDNPKVNGIPLTEYNDGRGEIDEPYTFAEIADLIERFL